jgi:hypothetical protein
MGGGGQRRDSPSGTQATAAEVQPGRRWRPTTTAQGETWPVTTPNHGGARVGDDGYSHGELVTAQEKIIGNFSYFGYFANRPLYCVIISFKPKVLVSPKIFQILWLAVGLTENNKRVFGLVGITVLLLACCFQRFDHKIVMPKASEQIPEINIWSC